MTFYLGRKEILSKTGERFSTKIRAGIAARSIFRHKDVYKIVKKDGAWKVRILPRRKN